MQSGDLLEMQTFYSLKVISQRVVLILLILILQGCEDDNNFESTSLQGRWLNCLSSAPGSGVELVFHGSSWAVYSNDYDDSSCEIRTNFELVEQGEFIVGQEVKTDSGIVAREFDLTARFGNIDNYKMYFDVFYIERGKLYFGVNHVGDLSNKVNRPTDIDFAYSFKRS